MLDISVTRFAATVGAVLLFWSLGCSISTASEADERELVVFAASSLTEAFGRIATRFEEANPGVRVTLNFAGSQRLSTQLEHGAPADVFASADWQQMNAVVEAGLVSGDPVSFASNQLVLIVFSGNTQIDSLSDLAQPGLRLVLAQPEVPVGAYTRQVLNNLAGGPQMPPDFTARVLSNVVSEENNVRNVAQKVALGEADAGIVYLTDASSADIAGRVRIIPIPDPFNIAAGYPIAALKESSHPDLARQFIELTRSDAGQQVLAQHGFGPAAATRSGGLSTVEANGQ